VYQTLLQLTLLAAKNVVERDLSKMSADLPRPAKRIKLATDASEKPSKLFSILNNMISTNLSQSVSNATAPRVDETGVIAPAQVSIQGMSLFRAYLCEPVIAISENPFYFWKQYFRNHQDAENVGLGLVVRHYLCAPPSSVASERLFSTAGLICSPHRSQLTADRLEMLIALSKNLKLLHYKY
jgi:hypothetical protein